MKYLLLYLWLNKNPSHLSDSIGQDLNDLVVRCGDDTLPVDFNDAMPNTNASSLCYTAPHQTADLQPGREREFLTFQKQSQKAPQKASKLIISLKNWRK